MNPKIGVLSAIITAIGVLLLSYVWQVLGDRGIYADEHGTGGYITIFEVAMLLMGVALLVTSAYLFLRSRKRPMRRAQLAAIESTFGGKLPSEFKSYITANPDTIATKNLSWSADPALIKAAVIELFEETLRFDMAENNYWPAVFGKCPESLDERVAEAMAYIATLPPLLPLRGRYLMSTTISDADREPPVLSFYQFVDTIYMYASLEDFLNNKPVSDEGRKLLPRAVGWDKVFDGLGASDDELYKQ
jgi:hypothetical protein